jgi:hypothetical protein
MVTKKKKIEYKIVSATSSSSLVELVNINLDGGWELLGGVSLSIVDFGREYCREFAQAMIRKV